jgi:glyoxylase-like metal-dependent hydrolase (beta-lactamase superfamily II)
MREIVEGVHQLEIPMRRNPLGKTYSYLLRDAGTLIDTGIPTKKGLDALENQLSTLGLVISDIERILVTHMHTDHVGLIDRIQQQTSVTVIALEEAVNVQRQWDRARETAFKDTRDEIAAWGGSNFLELFSQYEHVFRRPRWKLEIDETLTDRARLQLGSHSLEAFWTPGHAREHLCLYEKKSEILFSGDHVLPKITSHISHHTYHDGDPLGDYLKSLNKVRDLPVKTVLPGHERVFHDLSGRVSALKAHHERRCDEIIAVLRGGVKTVFGVSSVVSWDSRPWNEMAFWTKRMAAAETYAHLVYLRARDRVKEKFHDGILVYEAA